MLTISDPLRPSSYAYYCDLAREDYYLTGDEPLGRWLGEGAAALGLAGAVRKPELGSLFAGRDPKSGQPLVRNPDQASRQSGWDLTFSAPKSLSCLYALASDSVQLTIENQLWGSVDAVVSVIENRYAGSRVGKAGRTTEPCRLLLAGFLHVSSRAQDSQLHIHALLLNVAFRQDGSTGTIVSKPIFQNKMLLGALFRAELASRLQRTLGLEIETDRKQFFAIKGVSKALCDLFSKRRAAIEKLLEERGLNSAVAAKVAALDSRPKKTPVPRDVLRDRWRAEAATLGVTWRQLAALLKKRRPAEHRAELRDQHVATTLEAIIARVSVFTERDLLLAAALSAPGTGLDAAALITAVRHALAKDEVVKLGERKGVACFTTKEVLSQEKQLLAEILSLANNQTHALNSETVKDFLHGKNLGPEQSEALHALATQGGAVRVLSGLAGTGKSTILAGIRELYENAGYTVIGAAVSAKAASGLQESSGIKSTTIAKTLRALSTPLFSFPSRRIRVFAKAPKWNPASKLTVKSWRLQSNFHFRYPKLRRRRLFPTAGALNPLSKVVYPTLSRDHAPIRLSKKTVLVLDEAGMIDTPALARLVSAVKEAGATLILSGDHRQLQPLGRGGFFKLISDHIGASTLTEIKRQSNEWAKKMVALFSEGRATEALEIAKAKNLLHVSQTSDGAREKLIRDWRRSGARRPEQNLILCGTRQDAEDLNRRAQRVRRQKGYLGAHGVKVGEERIHRGDRVMFTTNSPRFGVQNGQQGSVTAIRRGAMHAQLDDGRTVVIDLNAECGICLGYAVTTHKAQGATTGRSYVLIDPVMQDREITYVQASRARGETHFYVDRPTAGADLAQLASLMNRSRQAQTAAGFEAEVRRDGEDERERLRREEEQRRQEQTTRSRSQSR